MRRDSCYTVYPFLFAGLLPLKMTAQQPSVRQRALAASVRVADKLIRDTRFSLRLVPQKEELGMQVIDFREMIGGKAHTAFAVRHGYAAKDTTVIVGLNHAGAVTIWLNGKKVYDSVTSRWHMPREHAYNRFLFDRYIRLTFVKGDNELRLRYTSSGKPAVVFLRAQTGIGEQDNAVRFDNNAPWLMLGPFARKDVWDPAAKDLPAYLVSGNEHRTWRSAPQRLLPELLVDSTLTYTRDPYLDWNYSNGNTVWGALQLSEATGDPKYKNYVQQCTGFLLTHLDYFRAQYDSLFAFRGSFHRLFRMSMLDDAGSAVLPYIDLYRMHADLSIRKKILEPVADYILHKQVRLSDGTFCRPEPVAYTVWCDDLFMSVPFLLRWAEITGNTSYYDEAVRQFRGFRSYLHDPRTGLFQHGWFSTTRRASPVRWGRANGWIAWATLELLERLPASHAGYAEILASFREQMRVLRTYQEKNGMWHQVLDRPGSFEETSCTAMFTMAMAKGVRKGWLDDSYRDAAIRGWQAVERKIEADGTVHDICRGTEIGFDEAFYFERKRFDQDPRGLGSVIAAGIEVSKLK